MKPVLGPCPCQGCGVLVWWARLVNERSTYGLRWREKRGRIHVCGTLQ